MTTIAILSALPREIALVQDAYPGTVINEGGLDIMHYHNGDNHVFSAFGGMGTTNIAAAAQALLTVASFTSTTPQALLFTGIAGNLNARLGFGDIVLARSLVYEQTDTAIIAQDPPYMESFSSTEKLLNEAAQILRSRGVSEVASNEVFNDSGSESAARAMYTADGIRSVTPDIDNHSEALNNHRFVIGTVATSNLFSTDAATLTGIISDDNADAEEMEGAAVAHVAAKNGVDVLITRAISNDCGESYEQLDGREDDLNVAARLAAQVTIAVADTLLS
ncbi:5'-methylthioadenosine/S-adenosylhomocysteine nucleosidase [Alloscardovia venturai]|uniref:5'-methylthioadenosine/S-adenosylhomocysteine nucleosidase n=1 Tax=Alloscardovia venturai TaxID=1769421 RepID=A0ABW2Y6W5_9BIFI